MANHSQLVKIIIQEAGRLLLSLKKEGKNPEFQICDGHIKARADQILHEFLIKELNKVLNIPIVSEEDSNKIRGKQIPNIDECFIIDPIDGTASFVNGFPGYVIQIAYLRKGTPIYSFVYAPKFDNLYSAIRGEGAYLNGYLLKVRCNANVVFIDNYPTPSKSIIKMMAKFPQSLYLESGSIGLKICRVAEGVADIFYKDVIVRDWDIIPPMLILNEAGGFCCSLDGHDLVYFQNNDFSHKGLIAASGRKLVT